MLGSCSTCLNEVCDAWSTDMFCMFKVSFLYASIGTIIIGIVLLILIKIHSKPKEMKKNE